MIILVQYLFRRVFCYKAESHSEVKALLITFAKSCFVRNFLLWRLKISVADSKSQGVGGFSKSRFACLSIETFVLILFYMLPIKTLYQYFNAQICFFALFHSYSTYSILKLGRANKTTLLPLIRLQNKGNGNGLLFHMTQTTSRSTIKAIACSKPNISEH